MAGSKTEKRAVEIVMNGVQPNATIKELGKSVRTLRAYITDLKPGTKDFVEASKRLNEVNGRYQALRKEINGTVKGMTLFKNQFFQLTTAVVGGNILLNVFNKIASFFPMAIQGAADLSDQIADIQKTTGMSAEEAEKLNRQLSGIDTRTSTKDLREIAIVAGQLGIAKGDIAGFTESIDKLNVALGDEFGDVETITKEVGALRNIFKDVKTGDVSQDLMRIGNALNELGAAGMATGPVVSDFANRIGSIGIPLGFTSDEVLGLSATLQELNVATERGGTAVGKTLLKMTKDTDTFAKVAGMPVKEFEELLNKDLFGAFMKVVEGSQRSASSATEFSAILDKLGLDGAGTSEVFSKLGGNTDMLREKVALAGEALQDTDSVMAEFNVKNDNFAARWEKAIKVIERYLFLPIQQAIAGLALGFANMVNPISDAEEAMRDFEEQAAKVNKLEKDVRPLISRYEELRAKAALSKDEQQELTGIIANLAQTIPFAVTEFDKYGKAISINTELAKKWIETEKARLQFKNKDAIAEGKAELKDLEDELKHWLKASNDWDKTLSDIVNRGEAPTQSIIDRAEKAKSKVSELSQDIIGAKAELDLLTGKTLEFNEVKQDADTTTTEVVKDNVTTQIQWEDKKHKEKEKKQKDHEKEFLSLQEKEFKDSLEMAENFWARERALAKQQFADGLITEAEYGEEMFAIESARLNHLLTTYADYGQDAAKIQEDQQDLQLQKMQDALKKQKELVDNIKKGASGQLDAAGKTTNPFEIGGIGEDAMAKLEQELAMTTLTEEEKLKIKEEFADAWADLEQQKFDELAGKIQQVGDMFMQGLGAMDALATAFEERELQRLKQRYNKDKAMLDEQLAKKQISEEQYRAKLGELDSEFNEKEKEIKRQQAVRDKALAIFDATIKTAAQVASVAAIPPLAIATGLLGAAQIAAIVATPIPEFAKGGPTISKGGPVSHPTLAWVGEKGREWVAPNWMLESPVYQRTFAALEEARVRGFAEGGPTTSTSSAPAPMATPAGQDTKVQMALISAIDRLNKNLENPVPGRSFITYDDIKEAEDKVDSITRRSEL